MHGTNIKKTRLAYLSQNFAIFHLEIKDYLNGILERICRGQRHGEIDRRWMRAVAFFTTPEFPVHLNQGDFLLARPFSSQPSSRRRFRINGTSMKGLEM